MCQKATNPYNHTLGFILEGHGEYETIPAFTCKILGSGEYLPRVNCGGIGSLFKNIEEHLYDLIRTYSPKNIIICFDLKDALEFKNDKEKRKLFTSCINVISFLNNKIDAWIKEHKKFNNLIFPNNISIVVAVQTFDSWLISDIEGLKNCELIDETKITENFNNVDVEVSNPLKYLNSKCKNKIDIKKRRNVKKIVHCINTEISLTKSRSFLKFYKEVKLAFNL